jgi:hypothetical protein
MISCKIVIFTKILDWGIALKELCVDEVCN